MNDWEAMVLNGVYALGGQADLRHLCDYLGRAIPLQPFDLRRTEFAGRPAYQRKVRRHVANLRNTGELRRITRGLYALTEKGFRRLQDNANRLARLGRVRP